MKHNNILRTVGAVVCAMVTLTASAQEEGNITLEQAKHNGWEFEVKAGVNIGGAAPLSMPREIRKIESYSPRLNASLEGMATKWLDEDLKWGISSGLKVEEKGMITGAQTKGYSMEIIDDGSRVAGYWTGYVKTKYNSTLLTVPLMANYRWGTAWKVRAGVFMSVKLDGEFSGHVTDGYLRENNPTGEKIAFTNGKVAAYDFSTDLRHVLWGAQVGGTWRAYRHFTLNADLTWGFNNIFHKSFKTITFNMYPIYMNVGFGYTF